MAAHWTEQQYGSIFVEGGSVPARLVLVAGQEETAAIFGFLIARSLSGEWELENIVVASNARGRGVATQLIAKLLSEAECAGGVAVFLEVRESNTQARRLYEKVGFEQVGQRKGYYSNPNEDAALYSKTLQIKTVSG
jgi:ribosomal-protein-alanine N-acetyltransferase